MKNNSREIREPEIFACAKALRQKSYKKVGAIGFCYGGWAFTFETVPKLGLPLDYQYFPGVKHGSFVRDAEKPGVRDAMVRAKNAAVSWFKQFLCD
ncbi:hypothetical protein PABG_11410 [Paracoccidioides brasiliensis Pb03]|nr:hypothetical protein PABG_11410 [Paracoccidioides brasiliensis Pb03]